MILIALGSNLSGIWGEPRSTLRKALEKLDGRGIPVLATSKLYSTEAQSDIPQSDFLNAVAAVSTPMAPLALLRVLKLIEVEAGRRQRPRAELRRWPPRQLDLDIICYKATICNWTGGRPLQGKPLVLPHPRAHERAFVLTPILDIAPNWHHPVFGLTAAQLLKRPIARGIGAITGVEGSLR